MYLPQTVARLCCGNSFGKWSLSSAPCRVYVLWLCKQRDRWAQIGSSISLLNATLTAKSAMRASKKPASVCFLLASGNKSLKRSPFSSGSFRSKQRGGGRERERGFSLGRPCLLFPSRCLPTKQDRLALFELWPQHNRSRNSLVSLVYTVRVLCRTCKVEFAFQDAFAKDDPFIVCAFQHP